MLADAHIQARAAIVRVFSPLVGGEVAMQGAFPKLSDTPGEIVSPGPILGQDTDAILDVLGYSPEDRDRLRTENVI